MSLSTLVYVIVLPILAVTLILVFVRLARGPHILDRVLSLDFMTVAAVGILGVYAVVTEQQTYLDVAMVVALLGFLGTIGFTFYIERRMKHPVDTQGELVHLDSREGAD